MKMKRRHKRRFPLLPLILIALLILGRMFVFHTVRIEGTSMNNTLKRGDVVLVVSLLGSEPNRGDIVECRFPGRDGTYVKRVIGLPGEFVEIAGNDTLINGLPLQEKYVSSEAEDYSIQLGHDQYLLLGDNRAESYDSRAAEIGPADLSAFTGRVVFKLWPFGRIN